MKQTSRGFARYRLVLGFAPVLIILILGLMGLIIYAWLASIDFFDPRSKLPRPSPDTLIVSPTPDPTANWKTYRNEEYEFEIKHPSDWIISEGDDLKNNPTIWLRPKVPIKQMDGKRQLEIGIGGIFIYSEKEDICTDQNCEEYGSFILNTKRISRSGKRFRFFNPNNISEYFISQVALGLQNKKEPYATATYFTEEQERFISDILSTVKFPYVFDVALSFIGSHQAEDKYYLHVGPTEEIDLFVPESITLVDPSTNQPLTGSFQLSKKKSELCGNRILYETEEIGVSEFPQGFWHRHTVEPYYIFRIKGRLVTGKNREIVFKDRPFICESLTE